MIHKPVSKAVVLMITSVAIFASQALACTLHVTTFSSLFSPTYPGSLNVAIAVGNARSENRLTGTPLENGEPGLMRASTTLKKLGYRFDRTGELPKSDFFLILAGQQLWTYYRAKKFGVKPAYAVHVHSAEPIHDVPVVVTSYLVIRALKDGAMTYDEAREGGLIQIRNDNKGQIETMFDETFSGLDKLADRL